MVPTFRQCGVGGFHGRGWFVDVDSEGAGSMIKTIRPHSEECVSCGGFATHEDSCVVTSGV